MRLWGFCGVLGPSRLKLEKATYVENINYCLCIYVKFKVLKISCYCTLCLIEVEIGHSISWGHCLGIAYLHTCWTLKDLVTLFSAPLFKVWSRLFKTRSKSRISVLHFKTASRGTCYYIWTRLVVPSVLDSWVRSL